MPLLLLISPLFSNLACSSSAYAGSGLDVSIWMAKTKPNGATWDPAAFGIGGPPDPYIAINNVEFRKQGGLAKCKDKFECHYSIPEAIGYIQDASSGSKVAFDFSTENAWYIELKDEDAEDHDSVGFMMCERNVVCQLSEGSSVLIR